MLEKFCFITFEMYRGHPFRFVSQWNREKKNECTTNTNWNAIVCCCFFFTNFICNLFTGLYQLNICPFSDTQTQTLPTQMILDIR